MLTLSRFSFFPLYFAPAGQLPNPGETTTETTTTPVSTSTSHNGQERRSHVAPKSIECEFCSCELTTMEGRILKYSTKAKQLRDASESIDRLNEQVQALKTENESLKNRLNQPQPENKKSGW